MNRIKVIGLFIVMALFAIACQPTGDSADDAAAAQSFFPQFADYTSQQTDDLQSAMTAAMTTAGLATGNIAGSALIVQVDSIIRCYREVGAVDAQLYIENPNQNIIREGIRAPIGGALVIVNQDRLISNLGPCFAQVGGMRAQSAMPEPCMGNGTFNFEGETIGYFYAATDGPLCTLFDRHFAQYRGN